jgi:hypothetical protein
VKGFASPGEGSRLLLPYSPCSPTLGASSLSHQVPCQEEKGSIQWELEDGLVGHQDVDKEEQGFEDHGLSGK